MNTGWCASITMLIPSEYLSTSNDHLYLVGKTDAARVQVTVNTIRRYEVAVVDSVFHLLINFGYGVNEIVVSPLSDDSMTTGEVARVEILSSPHSTGRLKKLYPPYQFHASAEEGGCLDCHPREKHSRPGAPLSDAEGCTECHTDFADRTLLHTSLKTEDCATCHNQQTNQVRKTGAFDSRNPCYNCHSDKIEKFDREFIHGPVAGGSCTVCHDPHGSPFQNSLVNVEEVLCFSCHEFNREFKEMSHQHKPFRDGHCGACHDPHATSNRWVLSKSSEDLCFECHSSEEGLFKNHTHPYNVRPKKRYMGSIQLSKSGKLECISCHDPHASSSEHLLRCDQENTCLGCHTEKL